MRSQNVGFRVKIKIQYDLSIVLSFCSKLNTVHQVNMLGADRLKQECFSWYPFLERAFVRKDSNNSIHIC